MTVITDENDRVVERVDPTECSKEELVELVEFLYEQVDQADHKHSVMVNLAKSLVDQDERIVLSLKRFFEFLDYTEESDGGKMFHPITISCCRAMMLDSLNDTLQDMKEYMLERTECEGVK